MLQGKDLARRRPNVARRGPKLYKEALALLEGELAHQEVEALAQLQEEALAQLQEEALAQQGGQALALQGGRLISSGKCLFVSFQF